MYPCLKIYNYFRNSLKRRRHPIFSCAVTGFIWFEQHKSYLSNFYSKSIFQKLFPWRHRFRAVFFKVAMGYRLTCQIGENWRQRRLTIGSQPYPVGQRSKARKKNRSEQEGLVTVCFEKYIASPDSLSKSSLGFYGFCEYSCPFTADYQGGILFPAFLVCLW